MFPSFFITFRETFEAALIVSIVLTFLIKTDRVKFTRFVWYGASAGVIGSIMLAVFIEFLFGGMSGIIKAIFEGSLMFVTAGFITWMIMWVHRQKDAAKKIKAKVAMHLEKNYGTGIFIFITASVLREGVETVLYLKAGSIIGQSNQLIGALLGIVFAVLFVFVLFRYSLKLNLKIIFNLTGIFLILFAAGLVSHGVHEFQEASLLPVFATDPVINISHILNHKDPFGSILRTLFGYTSKPTILEIFSYIIYVAFIFHLQKVSVKAIFLKNNIFKF